MLMVNPRPKDIGVKDCSTLVAGMPSRAHNRADRAPHSHHLVTSVRAFGICRRL
jgi:hypothetical protein